MKKISKIIPKYSIIPIFLMSVLAVVTYIVTKFFFDGGYHYDISTPIDDIIPFVPSFIIIYILAYVQWFWGIVLALRESKEFFLRAISAEMIAKFICLIIFIILPTSMVRPEITGTDIFSQITKFIYTADTPTNLFPSIHCIESWIIFRISCHFKKCGKWVAVVNGVLAVLVFASVVLVKQHLFLDIPSAILLCEIGLFLSKKFKTERVFLKIERAFKRREQV